VSHLHSILEHFKVILDTSNVGSQANMVALPTWP